MRHTFPFRLRTQTRTAALMLSAIQTAGSGPRERGLQCYIGDLIDSMIAVGFLETFGISITEFLASQKKKLSDPQLRAVARSILARKFAVLEKRRAQLSRDGDIYEAMRRDRSRRPARGSRKPALDTPLSQ